MSIPQKLPAILALTASITILLSSILCLAFKMTAFTSYMEDTNGDTVMRGITTPSYERFSWFDEYSQYLMPVVRAPLIIAGSFGLLYHGQRAALIIILGANALLATVSPINVLVKHGRSAHIDPEYISPPRPASYGKGYFSLEEWAREIPHHIKELGTLSLGLQCVGERVSRILIVVMCFFSLALTGLLVWDLNTTQVAVARPKTRNSWEDDDWA
ncbi:uncharacterized protein LY79DRAFT_583316 [Colletotrichum navitas]|uniref:Uncharacterized protein n=1 Tax=Colletotrichum navitas TaxID=681940 RepID=A0AAD8UZQ9_9PEZI|nr:uncharacterized protein LY79DRAFT_583316 [Colletotrichum navitas]KAK1573912.1 hypothetical protein LY79DRAFT_583316 [Colletotrichum navitas]